MKVFTFSSELATKEKCAMPLSIGKTPSSPHFFCQKKNDSVLPSIFEVEGSVLLLTSSIEKLAVAEFWQQLENRIEKDKGWDSLWISCGGVIDRIKVEELAKLKLQIPPKDIKEILSRFSLETLEFLNNQDIKPIHRATYIGSIHAMEKALEKGCLIDDICDQNTKFANQSPLSIAFYTFQTKIFEWLLQNGADPSLLSKSNFIFCNSSNWETWTPLFKKYGIINSILKKEMEEDELFERSKLHYAAENEDTELLKFLLDSGADINITNAAGETPLYCAITTEKIESVKFLLSRKEKCTQSSKQRSLLSTAAKIAVVTDQLEILELLLRQGFSYEGHYAQDPAYIAINRKHEKMLQLLKSYHYKFSLINEMFFELLDNYEWKKIHTLFSYNLMDVNIKNKTGTPFFHLSILNGQNSLCDLLLLDKNLNLEAVDLNGMTALHVAICREQTFLVSQLIAKGANVNATTPSKITPLHIAILINSLNIVKMLIESGADLQARDYFDRTPYHLSLKSSPSVQSKLFAYLLTECRSKNIEITISSPFAFKMYKETRTNLNKNKEPYFLPLLFLSDWKEMKKKKLCAHIFHKNGISPQIEKSKQKEMMNVDSVRLTRLEGMEGFVWVEKKIVNYLERLSRLNHTSINPASLNLLLSALRFSVLDYSISNERMLERIQKGEPTFLSTGYWSHAVKFFFWKEHLFLCNLSNLYKIPVEVIKFDPSKLDVNIIHFLRSMLNKPSKSYHMIRKKLLKQVCASKGAFEMEFQSLCTSQIGMQVVGNCVYASIEGASSVLWMLQKVFASENSNVQFDSPFKTGEKTWLKQAKEGSEEFSLVALFLKMESLNDYFDFHLLSKSVHYPDTDFVSNLMASLEKLVLTSQQFTEKLQELQDKFTRFFKLFPPIKFFPPLPRSISSKEFALKESHGREPTYYSLFADYIEFEPQGWA